MTSQQGRFARLVALLRQRPIIVIFALTFGVVAALNPMKVALLIYGINKLVLFSWVGFHVDGWLHPRNRPEQLEGPAQGAAWKRRTWIIVACIVFAALLP